MVDFEGEVSSGSCPFGLPSVRYNIPGQALLLNQLGGKFHTI